MPATPFPDPSVTRACSGSASAAPASALWPEPSATARLAASPATAVALNATGEPAAPLTTARAVWFPTAAPSVQRIVAMPWALVFELAAAMEPPPVSTFQATGTSAAGAPSSVTVTDSGSASSAPAGPDWPSPLAADLAIVRLPPAGGSVSSPQPAASPVARAMARNRVSVSLIACLLEHVHSQPAGTSHHGTGLRHFLEIRHGNIPRTSPGIAPAQEDFTSWRDAD